MELQQRSRSVYNTTLCRAVPQVAVQFTATRIPIFHCNVFTLFFIRFWKSLESFSWLNLNQCTGSINLLIGCVFISQTYIVFAVRHFGILLLIWKQFLQSSAFLMEVRPPPIHSGWPSCAPIGPPHRESSPSSPPRLRNFCLRGDIQTNTSTENMSIHCK